LEARLRLYDADPANRFIGDGLAETASYRWAGLPEGYARPLEALAAEGATTVDLLQRFQAVRGRGRMDLARLRRLLDQQVFPPGYALSFVFWERLSEEHGPDLPRRFLSGLEQHHRRDHAAALAGLRELTRVQDLETRLRQADVSQALSRLASLSRRNPTPPPP
jgi:hypothetical protein